MDVPPNSTPVRASPVDLEENTDELCTGVSPVSARRADPFDDADAVSATVEVPVSSTTRTLPDGTVVVSNVVERRGPNGAVAKVTTTVEKIPAPTTSAATVGDDQSAGHARDRAEQIRCCGGKKAWTYAIALVMLVVAAVVVVVLVTTRSSDEGPGDDDGYWVPDNDDPYEGTAVEGRPFVDGSGKYLLAEYSVAPINYGGALVWSSLASSSSPHSHHPTIAELPSQYCDQEDTTPLSSASTWAKSGLGEHASIASFAAFAIALQTNGAPPDLVRDALAAGLDEIEHAVASFEMASSLVSSSTDNMNKEATRAAVAVEPGPLPPSRHVFERDLPALALGAAREGCIDETVSALLAADKADAAPDGSKSKAILRKIALEEGRHSALAWRSVRWALEADEDDAQSVRRTVEEKVFKKKDDVAINLRDRFGCAFASVEEEWNFLYDSLVPMLTMEMDSFTLPSNVVCPWASSKIDDGLNNKSTKKQLVENILRDVSCSIYSAGSRRNKKL